MKIIQKSGPSRKRPKFAEGHKSGSENATLLKHVPKCEFGNHLSCSIKKKWTKRNLEPSSSYLVSRPVLNRLLRNKYQLLRTYAACSGQHELSVKHDIAYVS